MEKKNLDYELPQVKFVLVEVEQGFALSSSGEAEQYVNGMDDGGYGIF